MAEITGQVLQKVNETDTAPVISDVVITRKVWRIMVTKLPKLGSDHGNYMIL